jgi:hypothetical protein
MTLFVLGAALAAAVTPMSVSADPTEQGRETRLGAALPS